MTGNGHTTKVKGMCSKAAPRALPKSLYMIPVMVKPVLSILVTYPFCGSLDSGFQRLAGAGSGRAQPGFELAEGEFNRIKTGRVRGQIQQTGTPCGGNFGQSGPCTARPSADRLTAGPPVAASSLRNSSRVASGVWRKQAVSWTRAAASRRGAGPTRCHWCAGGATAWPRTRAKR